MWHSSVLCVNKLVTLYISLMSCLYLQFAIFNGNLSSHSDDWDRNYEKKWQKVLIFLNVEDMIVMALIYHSSNVSSYWYIQSPVVCSAPTAILECDIFVPSPQFIRQCHLNIRLWGRKSISVPAECFHQMKHNTSSGMAKYCRIFFSFAPKISLLQRDGVSCFGFLSFLFIFFF